MKGPTRSCYVLPALLLFFHSINFLGQAEHSQWMRDINTHSTSLSKQYANQALKIFPSGKILKGRDAITNWWIERERGIDSIFQIVKIPTHLENTYQYEIFGYTDRYGNSFRSLTIWKTDDHGNKRELEIVAEMSVYQPFLEDLEQRRAEWMRFSNTHEPSDLVKSLYAPNAIYYNHRPPISGRKNISREYHYMRSERYELKLTPVYIECVNDHLAFEIGQCSGSYPGKYLLVWQKNDTGKWYILLDSNI